MSPSWGYRVSLVIDTAELEDCATFTDTSGHADETYIRYLADLDLISGFADGTFGPDTTLTRAEAATLFEISNGYDVASLPTSAPAGCEFTDVAASDWFAGPYYPSLKVTTRDLSNCMVMWDRIIHPT